MNYLLSIGYLLMIVYYIFLINNLFSYNNFQNRFIRFSIKNIYQNKYEKLKKKIKNNNYIFKIFYTTEMNNKVNYEELNNYIQIQLNNYKLKNNLNNSENNIIKNNIIKNYLE